MKLFKRILKAIKQHKTIYTLCAVGIWLLFIDNNSYLTHRKLNNNIRQLEQQKKTLEDKISACKQRLEYFKTPEGKIKYGREKYYFKRKNEDIFLVEFDTIQ